MALSKAHTSAEDQNSLDQAFYLDLQQITQTHTSDKIKKVSVSDLQQNVMDSSLIHTASFHQV